MAQLININSTEFRRCNLSAIQSGGTWASLVPNENEIILISTTNALTEGGSGECNAYIVGDGRTAATALELKYLDDSTRPYIVEEVNKAVADIQPIEITGDVTNAPDEEDLTSENQGGTDVLKFKDKAYNSALYSGLGRVYLRKNIVTLEGTGKNVLTQAMVNTANTIYHIQYDYDLNGQTITLPAGCVLEFDGGSVSNGTLVGNSTIISAGVIKIFSSVTFSGTWANKEAYPEWFGEYGLWTDSENLFVISKSVRLTGATYWSPSSNVPTLRVRGTLFSDCQSEIRIAPPSNDFIGIQLGDPNGTIQTREKRLKLKGISVYLHNLSNAQRTAVLGISYTQGLTIENCSFVNSNTRNSVITKSVLDAPADTLNYGIVFYGDATGSNEITTFINSGVNADIAVYFKDEADFVNFYGGGFGCGNYGYGLIYGQQVTNLGFFGVSFNQGIRQIHVVTENPQKDATSGMALENCRFEQLYNGTIEDDVDGGDAFYASCVLTFELSSTNSAYTYGLYCANTLFPMGTKLRITNNKVTHISFVNCWCLSIDTRTPIDVAGCEYINLMFNNVKFASENVNINASTSQIVENIYVTQPSSSVTRYIFRNMRIARNSTGDRRTSGVNGVKPTLLSGEEKGFQYFNQSLSMPMWWSGTEWKNALGYTYKVVRGSTSQRPTLTADDTGYMFWDYTVKKPLFLKAISGSTMRWADGLGRRIDTEVYGTTRPTGLGAADAGQIFFDTSLGKPIFWSGTEWVDSTGVPANNSVKILAISQSDYDALTAKDNATLYVIKPSES